MILGLAGGTGRPSFSVSVAKPIGAVVWVSTENLDNLKSESFILGFIFIFEVVF